MQIFIPFNVQYLRLRYAMSGPMLATISGLILPRLLTRLASHDRVQNVTLISDFEAGPLKEISHKVGFEHSKTDNLTSANDVISNIFTNANVQNDVCVFYNPLFPFVSIDKLLSGYEKVTSTKLGSAIGGFQSEIRVESRTTANALDHGIFTVLRKSIFEIENERVALPMQVIGLSAAELICLRTEEDADLFNLIINSGMMS